MAVVGAAVEYLSDGEQVRTALSPVRRRLLELLREPASATELGERTGLGRQKVGYHLRVLERAGVVRLVGTRQRRGCTERLLQATAGEFVVDPDVLGAGEQVRSRDRFAAEHLAGVAADTVRTVSRLRAEADRAGLRLLTFTVEAEVAFAQPADVHAYADALAAAVAEVSQRFGTGSGRRYRVVVGGHPAAGGSAT